MSRIKVAIILCIGVVLACSVGASANSYFPNEPDMAAPTSRWDYHDIRDYGFTDYIGFLPDEFQAPEGMYIWIEDEICYEGLWVVEALNGKLGNQYVIGWAIYQDGVKLIVCDFIPAIEDSYTYLLRNEDSKFKISITNYNGNEYHAEYDHKGTAGKITWQHDSKEINSWDEISHTWVLYDE